MLGSNHSGALPPDASMIAKAIKEDHPHPRPLNVTVEHFFKGYPGFSMLVPKLGCVAAHPANVQRLLFDEQELVLVFPEGRKATEKLYKDRYRLRRFGRGGFVVAAMRARAPIVPVCVVGGEESAPVFVKVGAQHALLRRVVEAAEIDTVVDTRLVVDSAVTSPSKAHENNVIGTMNILAACSGSRSPVKKVVFKSSAHFYGCEQDDPAFFEERMSRPNRPRTSIERDVVEAEASMSEFAEKNPSVDVTVLR